MSNSNAKMSHSKVLKLVQLGVLAAVIVVMMFTPLGMLKVGAVEISFLMLPVAIGSIVCGPAGGAILGTLFGLLSFSQCFGISPFGSMLFSINPFFTFIMCVAARALAGYLSGIIFRIISKFDKTKIVSFAVSTLSAALLNTVFFVGMLMALFGKSDFITGMMAGKSFMAFVIWFVGTNGLVEAIVCCVIGTAISKALVRVIPKENKTIQAKPVEVE